MKKVLVTLLIMVGVLTIASVAAADVKPTGPVPFNGKIYKG